MSSFNSVFDIFKTPTESWQTRKWHYMHGAQLPTDWNQRNIVGVGTFAMSDSINDGFSITAGANLGDRSSIDLGDIRHYNFDDAIAIGECKRVGVGTAIDFGLVDVGASVASNTSKALIDNDVNQTFYRFITNNGASGTTNVGTFPVDIVFRSLKVELNASNVLFTIDGVLQDTITTTLPTVRQQPVFTVISRTAGAGREGQINQAEVFNT